MILHVKNNEDDRDYRYEIERLARWLLNAGYNHFDDEGAVDCAIRIIREQKLNAINFNCDIKDIN
jgi:hypothetical protein